MDAAKMNHLVVYNNGESIEEREEFSEAIKRFDEIAAEYKAVELHVWSWKAEKYKVLGVYTPQPVMRLV